ncbi:transglycosylase domain-containing protein [Nonlabens tegetincola]|uniref:transglycosylase domain-containing protein n=1 Tax=Nonlabens tegetincola TaxID=323273 RepID=UPI000CF45489|nr:transglycosylase domain-containing protein [Nonlabens tegetincola]PQJ20587.1 penicillin-binding protein [Nonlabens tegetincola]
MAKTKAQKVQDKEAVSKNVKLFWKLVFTGIGLVVLLFLLAAWGIFGALPDHTVLENPQTDLATEIITADGKTLGKFYNPGNNRTPVTYDELPQNLVDALVSTEDERFWDHSGIDGYGTARAFAYLGSKGGASTITQQLAKLYFTVEPRANKFERGIQKIREWIIATRLEKQYTKEEIIVQYLNQFDFLKGAIGIRSAARIYFGKEPKDLKVEESAVLVAMLKNPRQYNPQREISKKKSFNRRNQVFFQMVRNDKMTEELKDSLREQPIVLDFKPEGHDDGLATYFREYLRDWLKEWAKDHVNPDTGKNYNIYNDGLRVNVTIDYRMQEIAEQALQDHMKNLQAEFDKQNIKNKTAPFRDLTKKETENIIKAAMRRSDRWRIMKAAGKSEKEIYASFEKKTDMTVFTWKGEVDTLMTPRDSIVHYKKYLRAGLMSMNPQSGHVKAWVGGINHKHFKYDHVEQGKRQAGSTFKPFLYSTAVDLLHYSPCKELPDGEYTIPAGKWGNLKDWTPKDSGGDYGNILTLKEALAKSKNTISARLIDEVGPQPVIDRASQLGINTDKMDAVPSLALGTPDVNLFEMTGAYSVFANGGIYNKPVLVTSVEDKNGTILYQYVPDSKDVMNEETAYVTVDLMRGVVNYGSGSRLKDSWRKSQYIYKNVITGYPYELKNDIAGKTGTTQNNSDGWFMGMVPDLVTGVWVGGEDRSVHFNSTKYGQGATMALPIWGLYMKNLYNEESLDISKEKFKKPDNLSIETDCEEYKAQQSGGLDEEDDSDELEI